MIRDLLDLDPIDLVLDHPLLAGGIVAGAYALNLLARLWRWYTTPAEWR
jgi:hypothetical protein